jgi:predicted transcriptional regulator
MKKPEESGEIKRLFDRVKIFPNKNRRQIFPYIKDMSDRMQREQKDIKYRRREHMESYATDAKVLDLISHAT